MDKKIKVESFVDKFKKSSDKESIIASIINRKYVPILEKKLIVQQMFDKSIVKQDGIEYVDEFALDLNITTAILLLYTNLDLNASKLFEYYDLLSENGILDLILFNIGEKEIDTLNLIKDQIVKTFNNKQTTAAFVASQVTRFGELFGTLAGTGLDKLGSIIEDEEKMKTLISNATNIINKIK